MASDGTLSILIIFIFIVLYFITILGVNVQYIKKNWVKYKCNPLIMPIAGFLGVDAEKNHKECTSTHQSAFMQTFLEPIKYSLAQVTNTSKQNTSNANNTKNHVTQQKSFFMSFISGIFSKINNVLIEINRMGLSVQDIGHRISAMFYLSANVFTTMANSVGSTLNTVEDSVNPLRHAHFCFTYDTVIPTKRGIVLISNLVPGDILEDGQTVTATFKLKGITEDIYILNNISVSGNHKVYYNNEFTRKINDE